MATTVLHSGISDASVSLLSLTFTDSTEGSRGSTLATAAITCVHACMQCSVVCEIVYSAASVFTVCVEQRVSAN